MLVTINWQEMRRETALSYARFSQGIENKRENSLGR